MTEQSGKRLAGYFQVVAFFHLRFSKFAVKAQEENAILHPEWFTRIE
jgi:hypothetical protein